MMTEQKTKRAEDLVPGDKFSTHYPTFQVRMNTIKEVTNKCIRFTADLDITQCVINVSIKDFNLELDAGYYRLHENIPHQEGSVPTTKELLKDKTQYGTFGNMYPREKVAEKMIAFAKLHVQAALEAAYNHQGMSWTNSSDEKVKKELFAHNSYPLSNIK